MKKFFRNLIITAIVAVCGIALYQARQATNAEYFDGVVVTSVSSGYLTYTGTDFVVQYVALSSLTACGPTPDMLYAYLSDSINSGTLSGKPLITGTVCSPMPGRTGTINVSTTYQSFTGSTLYLHIIVKDNGGTTKGYGEQEITFVASGGGGMSHADRAALYTGTIYSAVLSGGINSNLNTVTAANVTGFSGLYFEAPGSGKLVLLSTLDLESGAVQYFLQHIPSYLTITNGFVAFTPTGSGASLNVQSQIYMYYTGSVNIPSSVTANINNIIVKDGSGNILASSGMVSSFVCGLSGGYNVCGFTAPHFTSFEMRPWLASVNITSSNGTGAWSGHIISLSFTGSEALTGVSVTIAGNTANLQGGGTSWYASGLLITGGTIGAGVPFTIDFRNYAGTSGNQVTGTSDSSYVNYYDPGSPTLTGAFTISGTSSTRTTGVTLILQSQSGVTYTISGNIAANLTGIMTSPSVTRNVSLTAGDGVKTIYVQFASGAVQSTLYSNTITLDQTAPNATGTYSTMALTNQDVIVTLTGYSEPLTGINATTYTFTGNGSFTFTFSDLAGNTGATTATVTWIDKTAVTGSVSYSPATLTNQNVVATLSLNKTGVTITNNSGATGYTFTNTGTFTFTFQDAAGNTGSTTATVTWIDKTAPTATISYAPASLTSGNVIATLTGYSESLTGINATGYTFTGNTSFTFTFSDLAGNTGATTATVTWIDKTAPTATVIYSTTGLTNQDVIATLTGYAESITGTLTHTFTGNGTYVFNFQDLAGNTAIATGTVSNIDKTAVTGSVSYSPATLTNQNVVATLSLNKTGVTITNNSGATGYTFTSSGIFIFTFQDAYGNTGSTTATVTWIDKVAPTASVMYTNTGANVLASLTGASETITGTTTRLFTGNGTYTFSFSDLAGNTGSAVATVVLTVAGTTTTTGSSNIGGATTTGVTFTSTGTLNIVSTGSANNTLAISVSGVVITASGGTWDGVLIPPTDLTGGDSNNATTTELGLSSSTNTVLLTIQAGATTDSLTISSGSYFNVSFVVSAGTNGDTLKLYRSTNGSTRTANVPDATCILNSSLVCSFRTDHLSYFTTVKETSSGGGGGGGGGSSSSDTSTGTTTVVKGSGSIVGSPFSIEINNAYLYAYDIGITTMDTIQKANITGSLIRAHMAKMMVNYAIKILGKYPDTAKTCTFTDTADQTSEMKNYITRACQLGLMGVNMTKFDPNGEVTRAQFGTVLSRSLYGTGYDGGTPYYLKHLNALKANNIITNINPDLKEIRGYVMLMLMRAQ